jgi:hypothetical protein
MTSISIASAHVEEASDNPRVVIRLRTLSNKSYDFYSDFMSYEEAVELAQTIREEA